MFGWRSSTRKAGTLDVCAFCYRRRCDCRCVRIAGEGKAIAQWLMGFSLVAASTVASGVEIDLRYDFDSSGFFTSERRAALSAAVAVIQPWLQDNLHPISPDGKDCFTDTQVGNCFMAQFANPSSGATTSVENLEVKQNELIVYAGARDLGGSTLGVGGAGGFNVRGDLGFLNAVTTRGQTGASATPATDIAPWGGTLSFNETRDWYIDPDPLTEEPFSGDDFFSVALHELIHLLGMSSGAASWNAHVDGVNFTGRASAAENNGNVELRVRDDGSVDVAHWREGTDSFVAEQSQEALMDPTLTVGVRKYPTELDFAALEDVGWMVGRELKTNSARVVVNRRGEVTSWVFDDEQHLDVMGPRLRIGSTGGERSFAAMQLVDVTEVGDDILALDYKHPDGLDTTVVYRLVEPDVENFDRSILIEDLQIHNKSASSLDLHLFQYANFDLGASASNDDGALAAQSARRIRLRDDSNEEVIALDAFIDRSAITPDGSGVAVISELTVDDLLAASLGFVDLLDASPSMLTPGDKTLTGDVNWAWQWDFTLAADSSYSRRTRYLLDIGVAAPSIRSLLLLSTVCAWFVWTFVRPRSFGNFVASARR